MPQRESITLGVKRMSQKKQALYAATSGCGLCLAAILAFSTVSTVSAAMPPPSVRMDRSKFLIGAYYLQNNAKTLKHVKAIREAEVDFIVGSVSPKERKVLDMFSACDVGVIVWGVVPGWGGGNGARAGKMHKINPLEKYSAGAAAFRDHPAIWGIDIGDEPSALDFPHYGNIIRLLKKAIPGMPLYLNLYPNYASVSQNNDAQKINQLGTRTYVEHIDAYCRKVPLDYISYDFYPYESTAKKTDSMLSKMYDNFIDVSDACRRTKRSFWYVPQVNSRVGLPPTSEDRLRLQANAAMSFGAEAITWGCWCKGWWVNNVLDSDGNRTEQYEKLKRVNKEIKKVAPHYMRFRNSATRFVGFPGKGPQDPSRPHSSVSSVTFGGIRNLRASNGAKLLAGEMLPRNPALSARALYVTAVDDPTASKMRNFELCFSAGRRKVKAFGGNGEIPVVTGRDGTKKVPIRTCGGVLIVVE